MPDVMVDKSCRDFAALLAAKESVPGGGGAAAYVGALSAALCSMVGNFTTGKKAYAQVEEDIQDLLQRAYAVQERLLSLVDEDARAFEPLSRAYGIPKDDPARVAKLEEATKGACVPPMEMMRQICRTIDLLEEMGRKGSKMLVSDVGCGALLARAALEAASLNVFVNTKTLQDRTRALVLEAECDAMLASYGPKAETIAADVMACIRG